MVPLGLLEFPGFSKIVELESSRLFKVRIRLQRKNGAVQTHQFSNISIVFTEFYPFEVSAPPKKLTF